MVQKVHSVIYMDYQLKKYGESQTFLEHVWYIKLMIYVYK